MRSTVCELVAVCRADRLILEPALRERTMEELREETERLEQERRRLELRGEHEAVLFAADLRLSRQYERQGDLCVLLAQPRTAIGCYGQAAEACRPWRNAGKRRPTVLQHQARLSEKARRCAGSDPRLQELLLRTGLAL